MEYTIKCAETNTNSDYKHSNFYGDDKAALINWLSNVDSILGIHGCTSYRSLVVWVLKAQVDQDVVSCRVGASDIAGSLVLLLRVVLLLLLFLILLILYYLKLTKLVLEVLVEL